MLASLVTVLVVLPMPVAPVGSTRNSVHLLLSNDIDVDILCASGDMDSFFFLRRIGTIFTASYWCGSWSVYLKHLRDSIGYSRKAVVVIPESLWDGSLSRLLSSHDFSSWLFLSKTKCLSCVRAFGHPSQYLYNQPTNVESHGILQSSAWNCTTSSYINLNNTSAMQEQSFSAAQTWHLLRNQSFILGCLKPLCADRKENIILDILERIGVDCRTVMVNSENWISEVRERRIDIMVDHIGCTLKRWRLVHFPGIFYYGRIVFYTVRKPSRLADEFLREAPTTFFALLFLSMVACAFIFCLINYRSGRKLLNSIQDVALVFVATVMLFSYPVPRRFEHVLAGRIVLFCWMVGGFSLAAYFQSVLTSSLSSRYGWDADDTIDKLYPKLLSGKVLPCVKRGSFSEHLLLRSDDKQGIINAMAAARQRSPDKNSTQSDTDKGCTDKVGRGSHVLVSYDWSGCHRSKLGNEVIPSKDTIYTEYGSTPVRKDFPLRDSYGQLVARIFETGIKDRLDKLDSWECSRLGDIEVSPARYDATHFLRVYCICCGAAVVVLAVEVLIFRIFRRT